MYYIYNLRESQTFFKCFSLCLSVHLLTYLSIPLFLSFLQVLKKPVFFPLSKAHIPCSQGASLYQFLKHCFSLFSLLLHTVTVLLAPNHLHLTLHSFCHLHLHHEHLFSVASIYFICLFTNYSLNLDSLAFKSITDMLS